MDLEAIFRMDKMGAATRHDVLNNMCIPKMKQTTAINTQNTKIYLSGNSGGNENYTNSVIWGLGWNGHSI